MSSNLPLQRLGRTGMSVTALSLGCAGLGAASGVTDASAVATVQHALAAGINYIDTSPLYGESERRVGLALAGVPRAGYLLSTKTGTHPDRRNDYTWDGTMWSVENSLRLLGCDYFDLLLVHDPRAEADMDTIFGDGGALDALEQLKKDGVVRGIGLGQRRLDWHRRAIESGRVDAILTYNDYHPLRITALASGLIGMARQRDAGVINGSPLAHGLLAGRGSASLMPHSDADQAKAARLFDWCDRHGISPVAVALQFSMHQPLIGCTLTGAKSVAELEQNLAAVADPLPDSLWIELESLALTDAE